jgi:hypothetical protein
MAEGHHMQTLASRDSALDRKWVQGMMAPLLVAALVTIGLAILVMFASKPVWYLLGSGRGLVSPSAYHVMALLIVLGTTFGQFAGWAAGTALLVYVWYLLGSAITFRVVQVSMSIVYCGLATGPIFFYHFLFGQPLAGLARPGAAAWVRQHHPEAYWMLFPGHSVIDLLVIPLCIAVLVLTWGTGERLVRQRSVQTLVLLLILLTSLAVALSLAIHATHAHLRFGA